MCDKKHYNELEGRVSELEIGMAKAGGRIDSLDVRLTHLAASVNTLLRCVYGLLAISFIVLLCTVVYGAIGERGLHSVVQESGVIGVK